MININTVEAILFTGFGAVVCQLMAKKDKKKRFKQVIIRNN